jgi:predicted acetyltransferase
MSLNFRWVDESEYDRVVDARLLCYGASAADRERYQQSPTLNRQLMPGDILLAERNGRTIGTSTSLDMRMWVRGGVVPCQGVAWVGTIKTSRRGSSAGGNLKEPGVATRVMNETIRLARERGHVVSALMPFRGSFYEHFGYGVMERRCTWTVPISLFQSGSFDGIRFFEHADLPELVACRQRVAQAGQCDIERPHAMFNWYVDAWSKHAMIVVDRPDDAGPVRGWMTLEHVHHDDDYTDTMRVVEAGYEDVAGLKRQLGFLGSLRDQYTRGTITLPADIQLNRLLRESQLTHRDNRNHATPECRPYTRMSLRILDHKRFIEAMHLPPDVRGEVAVTIHETEGHKTQWWIEIHDGRAIVTITEGAPHFECCDTTWAAVVTGDLTASEALRLGLASGGDRAAACLLDAFARGPLPFSHEYF